MACLYSNGNPNKDTAPFRYAAMGIRIPVFWNHAYSFEVNNVRYTSWLYLCHVCALREMLWLTELNTGFIEGQRQEWIQGCETFTEQPWGEGWLGWELKCV